MKKKNICNCGNEKEIEWAGDGTLLYPVFFCSNCGYNKRNEWKLWWDAYSEKWKDDSSWNNFADMISCIVGYFCHMYNEFYNEPYTFSFANPNPYKDKDFIMARRLLAMFNGNAKEIKTYIRWIFSKKIKTQKYAVKSFGFFASQEFVNEFKIAKSRSKVIRRTTPLPNEFILWCKDNCNEIFNLQELKTWNDLNGLVTHVKAYGMDNIEGKVVKEAVNIGLLPHGPEYRKMEE